METQMLEAQIPEAQMPELIEGSKALAAALKRLERAAPDFIALDTEFMRDKTYWPLLCLVQIAFCDELILIDALAPDLDITLLAPLLTNGSVLKVFHAAGQDLETLHHATGAATAPIFDTQDAAALLGYSEQLSYAALVQAELGVELGKVGTFSDWARRPLSAEQLRYGSDDVRYLCRLYPVVRARLSDMGRGDWLDGDFARKADAANFVAEPREQFRRLKRISSLKPPQLAVAREVAAWRECEAMRLNMPRRWLLSDETVLEIARRAPKNSEALRQIRGMNLKSASSLRHLLRAVASGAATIKADYPHLPTRSRPQHDLSAELDLMAALVRLRAKENLLSATQLAPRGMLEDFAATRSRTSPLLSGWRRAMIGEELLRLLEGKITLSLQDAQLIVREAPVWNS